MRCQEREEERKGERKRERQATQGKGAWASMERSREEAIAGVVIHRLLFLFHLIPAGLASSGAWPWLQDDDDVKRGAGAAAAAAEI